jgi:exodeoxyribonuclease V alpha subunit
VTRAGKVRRTPQPSYLGRKAIRGIGPVYAKKLVRAFGEAVFAIIEQESDRLREVTGIGEQSRCRAARG